MEVRDDFLSVSQYQYIDDFVRNKAKYRYRYQDTVMTGELDDEGLSYFPKEINGRKYVRHQINCYTPRSLAVFHVDLYEEESSCLTLVYYVNPTYELDEGGWTEILLNDEITSIRPVCNRALIFDGGRFHRATPYRSHPRFTVGIKYI